MPTLRSLLSLFHSILGDWRPEQAAHALLSRRADFFFLTRMHFEVNHACTISQRADSFFLTQVQKLLTLQNSL